jgi:hypothetical protein|tara:strand:- start:729 stop:1418 length:690 start_codon:yes stop_codon:yes gene_type:complete
MSSFNYDSGSEGEWEDRGEVSWNEFDWQQFLLRQHKETSRFISFYEQNLSRPDRLDHVASLMGWEREDWSVGEGFDDEDERKQSESKDEEGLRESDPYTLHRHPVYVVTAGLIMQTRFFWEAAFAQEGTTLGTQFAWRASSTTAMIERQIILMIQAVDMGDFLLAVCHGKLGLRALNETLALVDDLPSDGETAHFTEAMRIRLFDTREVCLRVMTDCREEDRRGFRDSD